MSQQDKDKKPCACESVTFDSEAARPLTAVAIRQLWPRFHGECECGFKGIAYASKEHYLAGDW